MCTGVLSIKEVEKKNKSNLPRLLVGFSELKTRDDIISKLQQNFDVMVPEDGLELMQVLPRFKPHVLIVESDLDSISGFQVTHLLRNHTDLYKIPIVLLLTNSYQIGEFWSKESGIEFCQTADEIDLKNLIESISILAGKSESDSIDDETWLRIENQFTGSEFIENFSTSFDQVLIESTIVNRIALLAQESNDFRKFNRSIMLLLRDILEYSAGAIRVFRNNEVYTFVHEWMSEQARIDFIKESNEYSDIYNKLDPSETVEEQTEIPLGKFKVKEELDTKSPTIFTLPLEAPDNTIGAITLLTYKSAARREYYLKTLQLIAHHIALALNNALLYQEVHRLSTVDELTSLPNRRAFYEVFQNELVRCKRFHVPLSLAILDIDHFKQVNDTYGHLQGDAVLKECAKVFSSSIRDKVDTIARLGGEEFVVLLPQTGITQARFVVERLHKAIQNHPIELIENSGEMIVTVSVGLTSVNFEKEADFSVDEILNAADKALYEAKEGGRNQIVESLPFD